MKKLCLLSNKITKSTNIASHRSESLTNILRNMIKIIIVFLMKKELKMNLKNIIFTMQCFFMAH